MVKMNVVVSQAPKHMFLKFFSKHQETHIEQVK